MVESTDEDVEMNYCSECGIELIFEQELCPECEALDLEGDIYG